MFFMMAYRIKINTVIIEQMDAGLVICYILLLIFQSIFNKGYPVIIKMFNVLGIN